MTRCVCTLAALLAITSGCTSRRAEEAQKARTAMERETWLRALLEHRAKKDDDFRGPASPLAAAERRSIDRGTEIYLEPAVIAEKRTPRALYTLRAAPEDGAWTWEAATATAAAPLGPDRRPLQPGLQKVPGVFHLGRYSVSAVGSGPSMVVFVFDAEREEARTFKGLVYYAPDPRYAPIARVEKLPDPQEITLPTTLGLTKKYRRLAKLHFELDGQPYAITAYQPEGASKELFIPFRDATSGKATYGAGRYLDLKQPEGDTLELDFNRAYSPMCNYSPAYNCPIPPKENHLAAAIEAGERTYGH